MFVTAAGMLPGCGGDDVAGTAGASMGSTSGGQVQTTTGQPSDPSTSNGTVETPTTSGNSATMNTATMNSNPTFPETTTATTTAPTTGEATDTDTTTGGGGPVCGDGALDPGEVCDDGPQNGPGAACNAMCRPNECGDSDQGPMEECDDGADNGDMNSCKSDCTNNVCGDGFVGPGEGCDDGNEVEDDECSNYSSYPATAPTRQLTSKLHGRNRWVFPRPAGRPPTASRLACPPGLEKTRRRAGRGRERPGPDFNPKQSRLPLKASPSAKRRGSPQIGAFGKEAVCPGVVRNGQDGPKLA